MLPTRSLLQQVFKAKKPWPPNFELMSAKHQFRLERRYRRRVKLKWARPRLQKAVTLAQWGSVTFVVLYGTFWADWGSEDHIFMPIRNWVSEKRKFFWSNQAPPRPKFSTEPLNDAR